MDIALPDVEQDIKAFRQAVADFGRDPDDVDITMVIMSRPDVDSLKRYRDWGVTRCNVGVGMENWDKPEVVMPMIEEFSSLVPSLMA